MWELANAAIKDVPQADSSESIQLTELTVTPLIINNDLKAVLEIHYEA